MATILEAGTANYSTKVSDRAPKHRTPARWFKLTENTAYRQHRQVIRMVAASILLFTGNLSMADTPGSLSCAATDPLQAYHATRYRSVVLDGISIFYREAGNPNCPTLLLLHGFSSSSHMFRDLMPLLSRQFHLVAPDYPGFDGIAKAISGHFATQ